MYGMDDGIINLVRNELLIDRSQPVRSIFNKAVIFFPNEDFNIIDISDLVYHWAKKN